MANLTDTTINGDLRVYGTMSASDRLGTLKALTNENVGTSTQYFLSLTQNWGKGGYCSVADAKTVLGLKSAAYAESASFALANHNSHDSVYLKTTAGNKQLNFGSATTIGTVGNSNVRIVMPANPFNSSGTYDNLTTGYAKNATGTLGQTISNMQSALTSNATNISNLVSYSFTGLQHWNWTPCKVGGSTTITPVDELKQVDYYERRSDTTKRVIGIAEFQILNTTAYDAYIQFTVKSTNASSSSVSKSFTLFIFNRSWVPFTQIMDLNDYRYDFYVSKPSGRNTQTVNISTCSFLFTNLNERTERG